MDSTLTTPLGAPAATATSTWPIGEILRDISRGGLAGAIAGIIGIGIGGRIAMRLAAIIVPTSAGSATENGNIIGDITVGGTFALLVLGLVLGTFVGTVWVVVSPWIPGTGLARALLVMPIAVALGTFSLVDADNADFTILGHDTLVVAILVGLVAVIGLLVALFDGWLDGRLPHPTAPDAVTWGYATLTIIGTVLLLPLVMAAYVGSSEVAVVRTGLALFAVGLATLAWWILRLRDVERPPRPLRIAARAALLAAVALGFVATGEQVSGAVGLS